MKIFSELTQNKNGFLMNEEYYSTFKIDNGYPMPTFESVSMAVHSLPKKYTGDIDRMELCRKHFKQLAKESGRPLTSLPSKTNVVEFYGVRIYIKPYLKKIRIYYV